jgi:hypothetical protein
MPRIRFLILRHQVWLLAHLLVIFVCLLYNLGTSLLCPLFSWESIAGTFWGRQKKQVERLFFCIGIIRFHMMSFPYCIIFLIKKKIGENLQDIFFSWHIRYCMSFHLISQFIMDYSTLLRYIWEFMTICKSRIASFLMRWKTFTIHDSPKGTSFPLWLFVSRNSG